MQGAWRGADLRCKYRSKRRFARTRQAADRDQHGPRRYQVGIGEPCVAADLGPQLCLLLDGELLGARHRHDGTHAGATGEKQRQAGQTFYLSANRLEGNVGVEYDVGALPVATRIEIHEQESKVVKDIDRRQRLAELQRIERDGPVVDEHDIAEVQVAVAAADAGGVAARDEQRLDPIESGDEAVGHVYVTVRQSTRQLIDDRRHDAHAIAQRPRPDCPDGNAPPCRQAIWRAPP